MTCFHVDVRRRRGRCSRPWQLTSFPTHTPSQPARKAVHSLKEGFDDEDERGFEGFEGLEGAGEAGGIQQKARS